jgi:hypothetical protein
MRVRHELHGARIECDGCERPLGRRDGIRVGSGFEFAVREMADALVRVGQGSGHREASFAVRMRAKERRVRSAIPIKNGLITDDPSLVKSAGGSGCQVERQARGGGSVLPTLVQGTTATRVLRWAGVEGAGAAGA